MEIALPDCRSGLHQRDMDGPGAAPAEPPGRAHCQLHQDHREGKAAGNPEVRVERGGVGAQAAERATIQAAIDAMMLDNLLAKVTANGTADYIRAEAVAVTDTDFGRGQSIVGYVRDAVTAYCYTWSSNGTILTQVVPGTAPCAATP